MPNKIKSKRYYRIEFSLASALSVSGGLNIETDKDIARNGIGIPYIPASSLSGIYRNLFDADTIKKYFDGIDETNNKKDERNINYFDETDNKDKRNINFDNSRIIVYDANIYNDDYNISKRDCVGLDEWKTSIKGAKFDFEIIEPGVRFITYIEQNKFENDENIADVIADAWKEKEIKIGGKISRGLGCVNNVNVKMREFSFKSNDDIKSWLDFDIYSDSLWEKDVTIWGNENDNKKHCTTGKKIENKINIKIYMKQLSPITIRTYTTEVGDNIPDYEQITYKREDSEKESTDIPVIPGTSWAGAFRHHMNKLGLCDVKEYFGYNDNKNKKGKHSLIYFSESEIKNANSKNVSRNAIDRFTGGTVENALFTEKMYYGGETSLEISFNKNCGEDFLKSIAISIADIHNGFLSIGGETSVGHGLFTLTKIECENKGINIDENNRNSIYEWILNAVTYDEKGE